LLEQVLQPQAEQRPARYQRYDWDRAELAEWHDVPSTGYLLIEGVTSSRHEFRPYLAASIWVQARRESRLQRGLERDGVQAQELWLQWQAAEDAYVQRHQPHTAAGLILSGENGVPWPGPERPDKSI
jgi:uridine kinase